MFSNGTWSKPSTVGSKPLRYLVAGSRERRERAAVERAGAADDPVLAGVAGLVVVLAHHLDRELHRLRAGISEEHGVGEGVGDQALAQALLLGDLEQVRGVPELLTLLDQRLDEIGVAMAQGGDRDAAREIEVLPAVGGEEVSALAPLERQFVPGIGRQ